MHILQAFSNIGLIPDGGANWFLTNTVGYKLAYQIAIEGERIDSKRCLELGLVNRLSLLIRLSKRHCHGLKLSIRSSQSLKLTKQIMRKALDSSYDDIYDLEAKNPEYTYRFGRQYEGVTAFMEKDFGLNFY